MSNLVLETSHKHDENGTLILPEEETLLAGEKEDNKAATLDKAEDGTKADAEDGSKTHPTVRRVSEIASQLYEDGETVCGIGTFRGKLLQKFANKNTYVILYGILGCVMGACGPYLTGTITTLEKRFRIPSTTTGN